MDVLLHDVVEEVKSDQVRVLPLLRSHGLLLQVRVHDVHGQVLWRFGVMLAF